MKIILTASIPVVVAFLAVAVCLLYPYILSSKLKIISLISSPSQFFSVLKSIPRPSCFSACNTEMLGGEGKIIINSAVNDNVM